MSRARTILVERLSEGTRVCLLTTSGAAPSLVASVSGPDLVAALASLRATHRRLPKEAWLVDSQVFVAGLHLPPRDALTPERIAGLVGYELEPLAPTHEPQRFAAGDQAGAQVLGAAFPEASWAQALRELEGGGLTLAGVLPGLGAGVALAPAPGQLLEIGPEGLAFLQLDATGALAHWEGGASLSREDVLRDLDSDQALVVLADSAAAAEVFSPDTTLLPPEGISAAAWAGAQRALGLPGGERVPALLGAPRSAIQRAASLVPVLCLGFLALALGLGEVVLRARESTLVAAVAEAQDRSEALRRAKSEQAAQQAALDARRAQVDKLQAQVDALERNDQRGASLALLLATLATTLPDEVSLESLEEGPHLLRLSGFSLDSAAVQRLSRDLGQSLKEVHLRPLPARVRATLRQGVPGYTFSLELQRVAVPKALPPGRVRASAQATGFGPLRVPRQQQAARRSQ